MARLMNVTCAIYVWADGGDDANPGTPSAPLKTIEQAVERAKQIHDAEVMIRFLPAGMQPSPDWRRL